MPSSLLSFCYEYILFFVWVWVCIIFNIEHNAFVILSQSIHVFCDTMLMDFYNVGSDIGYKKYTPPPMLQPIAYQ